VTLPVSFDALNVRKPLSTLRPGRREGTWAGAGADDAIELLYDERVASTKPRGSAHGH